MKKLLVFVVLLVGVLAYVVRPVTYKQGVYYSPRPTINTVCSTCYSGRTTCSAVIWHESFRAEGTMVEVCNPKNECSYRSVKKGGEWFWHFEWTEEERFCYTEGR